MGPRIAPNPLGVMKLERRDAGIVGVDPLRRMLTARSHVVDMSSLLHLNKAREMGETEVTAINVGWYEEVCWVTDVPGFVGPDRSPNCWWEAKPRRRRVFWENSTAQSCALVTTCLRLGLQVVGSRERVAHKAMHTEGL